MSDIQELIHKTSMDCIDKGQRMERERIIKLLNQQTDHACPECLDRAINDAIELIKGETKSFLTASQVEQMVDEMLEE